MLWTLVCLFSWAVLTIELCHLWIAMIDISHHNTTTANDDFNYGKLNAFITIDII